MVDPSRIYYLNRRENEKGAVVYWMQRDQRVEDNWALIYAQDIATHRKQPLFVVFCLVTDFLAATPRQYGFMIAGLKETVQRLGAIGIPFILLQGKPDKILPEFLEKVGAGILVTDFNPLRNVFQWKYRLSSVIKIPFHEIDAHNIIPARYISQKQEYGAQFLRRKIEIHLKKFLVEIPEMTKHEFPPLNDYSEHNWLFKGNLSFTGDQGNPTGEIHGGSLPAMVLLQDFIQNRLESYEHDRNDPVTCGQSGLSPYLHFGQISAQRVAIEVSKSDAPPESKKAFLEELIVRRELADNFCLYNPDYDSLHGFPAWAISTLNKHRDDSREFLYSIPQFEQAETHDELWNTAQNEMVNSGKMHGYMRMYWAKKILEWTSSPEEAFAIAIFLNNKYSLDGRDPSGYAGIAWAIGGVHDRPWGERKIFGNIRYMNYQGCKRKFNVDQYIQK